MQATAMPARTRDVPAVVEETRPVRLLVPTERRTDYWLSDVDTLRASDLEITRFTTDAELHLRLGEAEEMLRMAGVHTPADAYLRKLRDGLRHPRDIAEARDWGFTVPPAENARELGHPSKRLGWWWVYDPERVETREQREARYLSDDRLVDMRGFAAMCCRGYVTIKDLKVESDQIRSILTKPEERRRVALQYVAHGAAANLEEAEAKLLAEARKDVVKATPVRRVRAGQSDLWYLYDAAKWGRDTTRLSKWYEFNKVRQTGRPPGSRNRPRVA